MSNTQARFTFPLAIMAKAPIANKVKTRLIPELGAEEATRIHEQLVRQTVATALQTVQADCITLWTGLEHDHVLFQELATHYGIQLKAQPEGDLGKRMQHAFTAMEASGLLIGSDCPVLTPTLLIESFQTLSTYDVVLLPAEDGGYGLIGVTKNTPPMLLTSIFEGVEWGTERVFKQTKDKVTALNCSLACPATIWDVDRPEDVRRWLEN